MSPNTIIAIRARTRSSRLHSKCLQPLAGKPAIVHVGERAGLLRDVADRAVFCIPDGRADDELAAVLGEHFGEDDFYAVHRGPEWDPVRRTWGAIEEHEAQIIIEGLHGDAPLAYMGFVRPALQLLGQRPDLDCVRYENLECQVTMEHLACHAWPVRRSWWEKTVTLRPKSAGYQEHPTAFFTGYPEQFKVGFLPDENFFRLRQDRFGRPWDTRYCLDYPEDLVFLGTLFEELYKDKPITLKEAVQYVNARPHLRALNASRAESVLVYPTAVQKRKWRRAYGEWATPEGCEPVLCVNGSCFLGWVDPEDRDRDQRLHGLDGSVWKRGTVNCECGAGRSAVWTGDRRVWLK